MPMISRFTSGKLISDCSTPETFLARRSSSRFSLPTPLTVTARPGFESSSPSARATSSSPGGSPSALRAFPRAGLGPRERRRRGRVGVVGLMEFERLGDPLVLDAEPVVLGETLGLELLQLLRAQDVARPL